MKEVTKEDHLEFIKKDRGLKQQTVTMADPPLLVWYDRNDVLVAKVSFDQRDGTTKYYLKDTSLSLVKDPNTKEYI